MKERFRELNSLSKKNLSLVETINDILDNYTSQGYVLTLRQLYYQLVKDKIIPNKSSEYAKLSRVLGKARMCGLVDWNAIEDRLRVPKHSYCVDGIPDALIDTVDQYKLDRMKNQDHYIEVWIEKDALSSIMLRVTRKYHVRLVVNRGYASISAMYDAYNRFESSEKDHLHVIYLGDHDPSGLDMIRDIQKRMIEFEPAFESDLTVHPIALTMEQIDLFDLPPDPAKVSDPRAKWYIEKHGNISWELDALEPSYLVEILEEKIKSIIDVSLYQEILNKESEDKKELMNIVENYKG